MAKLETRNLKLENPKGWTRFGLLRFVLRRFAMLSCVLFSVPVFAGGSIFSANGHGEQLQTGGIRAEGLAGGGLGIIDSVSFNTSNPAALAFARNATIRIGMMTGIWSTTVNGETDTDGESVWKDFRIVLPVASDKWVFGFGIDPAQRMDVKLFERGTASFPDGNVQDFENRVSWLGSAVDVRLDNGYRINDKFSVGVGASFRFLHEDYEQTIDFDTAGYRDIAYLQTIEYRGWAFSLGAQYQVSPKLGIGAYFKPRSSGNWTHDYKKGSTDSTLDSKSSGKAPGEFGAGVALKLKKGYMLVGDVKYGMWDEGDESEVFGSPVQGGHIPEFLGGVTRKPLWISFANERVLERGLEAKSGISAWRGGIFYRTHYWAIPYNMNDNQTHQNRDIGVTLGGSIFVASGSGLIHGALELGQRSQIDTYGEKTSENFGRLLFQIEIAEKWFQKSKRRGLK